MKITIVKVAMFEGKCADALKPILFEIIDSILHDSIDIEVEYYDDRKNELPKNLDSDIIVLSFDTFSAKRAYFLAKKLKTQDNIVAMGGFHPTVCPQEAQKHCDVVLCGDAESIFLQFLQDYKSNNLKNIYDGRDASSNMALLYKKTKSPYRSKYLPLGLIQFSRGCKFECDFCSVKTMYPGKIRQKSIVDIVAEIKATEEKLLFFIDDNILYDEKSAIDLFNAIKPLKRKWACQISIEVANNDKLLKLMKESGCICVLIGFESLDINNLKSMGKSANLKIDDYEKAIENLNRHKLMIYGTFVIGYDFDDKNSASKIVDFALKQNLAVANFNPLIPLPGTPLYERLKGEGRLLYDDRWWLDENYRYGDTAFLPKNMTPKELEVSCKEARFRFYGTKSIVKRFFHVLFSTGLLHAWYFLIINIVSAIEIKRKQGTVIGSDSEKCSLNNTGGYNDIDIDKT